MKARESKGSDVSDSYMVRKNEAALNPHYGYPSAVGLDHETSTSRIFYVDQAISMPEKQSIKAGLPSSPFNA